MKPMEIILKRSHLHFLDNEENFNGHKEDETSVNYNFMENYFHRNLHDYLQSQCNPRADSIPRRKIHNHSHYQKESQDHLY
jgi:hypothetical protein